jgi:predicted amidophosphoribosyltransferase
MNTWTARLHAKSRQLIEIVTDLLFPPHARALKTRSYARRRGSLPLAIRTDIRLAIPITSLSEYDRKPVQTAIQALKYNAEPAAVELLAHAVNDFLQEEAAQKKLFSARTLLIVPIPLHADRLRTRGFNQIDKILARYGQIAGEPLLVRTDILARTRPTEPQTHLSRRARLANVADAFEVVSDTPLDLFHIYLLDDVTTTGSTLLHAGRVLEDRGATVTRLAIARA